MKDHRRRGDGDSQIGERRSRVPVVIYLPGMGRSPQTSADSVADALRDAIDRIDPSAHYEARTDTNATVPRGLKASKTIVREGDGPVLQLMELDYLPALEKSSEPAGPPIGPGLLKSLVYAGWGAGRLIRALGRPAKTGRAKGQLFLGFLAVGALVFTALAAVYSALVVLGVDLPLADRLFGQNKNAAALTLGITGLTPSITWAVLRKHILAMSFAAERMIRFVRNEGAVADTISIMVDRSVDRLRGSGWEGPIHLVGFSFGSLALYEAMKPRASSGLPAASVAAVESVSTIGCPLDLVRMYAPEYVAGRVERKPGLRWVNVFNAADILGSNLDDGNDVRESACPALNLEQPSAISIRYLDEEISAFQIFAAGRTHTSYWGKPQQMSCFHHLVPAWLPDVVPAGSGT